ncbi:MAG: ABC transporter substrate-binding protein [Erysipelotrichaceae bacterium]|nr:ABC transporter substrate-binding protein [Solobacterium sp.]MDY2732575.1 ABC transporter substrate-binding protein [Erysipelotrichaceae bacterium]
MKKLLVALLALLMVLTLTACGKKDEAPVTGGEEPTGEEATFDVNAVDVSSLKLANTKEYVYSDSREVASMDYLVTALASDHQYNVNFVDGLVICDSYGAYQPAVAESWTANEDATVWTFKLKKGVKWVTAAGDEYGEVTAEDFVTGLRHAAEFQSGTAYVVSSVEGFSDYMSAGDYSDEAWAKVGVKAVDDYTVEYTLNAPTPYFYTQVEYTVFYPVNKTFLESKGDGCKLGTPDTNSCTFGQATPDSILYNGAYILSSFDVKSQTVMVKNPAYYAADEVYLEKVTVIYDEGSDPYEMIRSFEQNVYAYAGLSTQWGDEVFNEMMAKYDGYVNPTLSNYYAFGIVFNYNRVTYENTAHADDADKENTKAAIRNENFRLAMKSAFDAQAYLEVSAPTEIAKATLRNINGVPNLVSTSDGTLYGTLVEDAYEEITGTRVSLADGQWPWLSKENALAYIEAAKADGITFPVHVDMLVIETSDRLTKQGLSFKQSIEENTDGQIIVDLIMRDQDTVQNIAYYSESWDEADYDISTFTGWGPDYVDPKSFVEIYSPVDGYYMHSCGLTDKGATQSDDFGADDELKTQLGFYEYEDLYRAADAITDDLDARYKAFAKADAYLLAHGLYIPTSMQTRSARVSHIVPFSAPYSSGVSQYKYRGVQLQEDVVTTEQYQAAMAAWEKGE